MRKDFTFKDNFEILDTMMKTKYYVTLTAGYLHGAGLVVQWILVELHHAGEGQLEPAASR